MYNLNGREAHEEIETAFRLELIDESVIGLEEFDEVWAAAGEDCRDKIGRFIHGPIEDTIAELDGRPSFDGDLDDGGDKMSDEERREYEALWRSQTSLSTPLVPRPRLEDSVVMPTARPEMGTVRHTSARVGRNDPCPCGSGKKFKKCCGAPR